MVNTTLLKKYIKKSGYKMGYLADQLGISRNGLTMKRDGVHPFTAPEAIKLCGILGIDTFSEMQQIFLLDE